MDDVLDEIFRRVSFIEGEVEAIKALLKKLKELEDAAG